MTLTSCGAGTAEALDELALLATSVERNQKKIAPVAGRTRRTSVEITFFPVIESYAQTLAGLDQLPMVNLPATLH
jgi:hypothetical protein